MLHFIDITIIPRAIVELPLSFPHTPFPFSGSQLEPKINAGALIPNKY